MGPSRSCQGEIRLAAQNTKTKRSRVIPINRELRTLLERLPRFSDGSFFMGRKEGVSNQTRSARNWSTVS